MSRLRVGWDVRVVLTRVGTRFVDVEALAEVTGRAVHSQYEQPSDPDVFPTAQAFVVAPATVNSVDKAAHGISHPLAVALVREGPGAGVLP